MATAIEQDLPFVMTCDAVEDDIVDNEPSGDDAGEGEPTGKVDVKDAAPEEPIQDNGDGTVTIRRMLYVVPENVKDEDQDALAKDEAIALDEKFHVATTFAECKAENKFRCRYHGMAAMQDSIEKFFEAKGVGGLNPKIKPFDLSDKDNLAYQFEVTCKKEQEKAVISALKAFAKSSGCIKLMSPDKSIKEKGEDKYAFFKVDYFDKDCKDPKVDAAPNEAESEKEDGVEEPEAKAAPSPSEQEGGEGNEEVQSSNKQPEAEETSSGNGEPNETASHPEETASEPAETESEKPEEGGGVAEENPTKAEEGSSSAETPKKPKKAKAAKPAKKPKLDEATLEVFAKCDKLGDPNSDIAETKASILDLIQQKGEAEKNIEEAKDVAAKMEELAKTNPLISTVLGVAKDNIKMAEQAFKDTDAKLNGAVEKLSKLADEQLKKQNSLIKESIESAAYTKKYGLSVFLSECGFENDDTAGDMVDKIVNSALGGDADLSIKEKAMDECGIEELAKSLKEAEGTLVEALNAIDDYLGKENVTKEEGAALVDKFGTMVEAVKTSIIALKDKQAVLKRKYDSLKKVKEAESAAANESDGNTKKSALWNVIKKLESQYADKDNKLTPAMKAAIGKKLAWLKTMAEKQVG